MSRGLGDVYKRQAQNRSCCSGLITTRTARTSAATVNAIFSWFRPGNVSFLDMRTATITKAQLFDTEGISLSAISSAGSMENIKLMRDNQAQFGILQGIFAAWAWNGDGPITRPQPWLRSICALWQNTDHFVLTRELARTGTIDDIAALNGERFVIGARNSGAERSGSHILDALDIDFRNSTSLAYMGYGATANAIQDGTIVGMNVPAGVPVTAITRAFAMVGEDLTLLSFTDAQLARVNDP